MIGSDARVPGMVLLRAPLGRRGSYVPTVLNVAQNLGWSTFELIIISIAAAKLSDSVFGFSARWVWAVAFGAVSVALGLLGPIGFVRRYVKKFAAWAVLASIVYLTWWVLDKSHVHAFWAAKGSGGMTFGQGVDLVIGSIVSWTPLAADYTRFARSRRSAFWGTGLGYFVPTLWCFGIGCLLVLARDISAPEQIPAAVAAGRAELLAVWIAGFCLYQWLAPVGPHWWTSLVGHTSPGHSDWTASLPSFAAAFGLTLGIRALDSARAASGARRQPLARSR